MLYSQDYETAIIMKSELNLNISSREERKQRD